MQTREIRVPRLLFVREFVGQCSSTKECSCKKRITLQIRGNDLGDRHGNFNVLFIFTFDLILYHKYYGNLINL